MKYFSQHAHNEATFPQKKTHRLEYNNTNNVVCNNSTSASLGFYKQRSFFSTHRATLLLHVKMSLTVTPSTT